MFNNNRSKKKKENGNKKKPTNKANKSDTSKSKEEGKQDSLISESSKSTISIVYLGDIESRLSHFNVCVNGVSCSSYIPGPYEMAKCTNSTDWSENQYTEFIQRVCFSIQCISETQAKTFIKTKTSNFQKCLLFTSLWFDEFIECRTCEQWIIPFAYLQNERDIFELKEKREKESQSKKKNTNHTNIHSKTIKQTQGQAIAEMISKQDSKNNNQKENQKEESIDEEKYNHSENEKGYNHNHIEKEEATAEKDKDIFLFENIPFFEYGMLRQITAICYTHVQKTMIEVYYKTYSDGLLVLLSTEWFSEFVTGLAIFYASYFWLLKKEQTYELDELVDNMGLKSKHVSLILNQLSKQFHCDNCETCLISQFPPICEMFSINIDSKDWIEKTKRYAFELAEEKKTARDGAKKIAILKAKEDAKKREKDKQEKEELFLKSKGKEEVEELDCDNNQGIESSDRNNSSNGNGLIELKNEPKNPLTPTKKKIPIYALDAKKFPTTYQSQSIIIIPFDGFYILKKQQQNLIPSKEFCYISKEALSYVGSLVKNNLKKEDALSTQNGELSFQRRAIKRRVESRFLFHSFNLDIEQKVNSIRYDMTESMQNKIQEIKSIQSISKSIFFQKMACSSLCAGLDY